MAANRRAERDDPTDAAQTEGYVLPADGDAKPLRSCSECGRPLSDGWASCPHDGTQA